MPTPSEVHVDIPLSNLAIKYQNPAFVGEKILPVIPVKFESGKYYKFGKDDQRRVLSLRADKDTSKRASLTRTTETYSAQEYALHDLVSDREKRNADTQIKPEKDAVNYITQRLLLDQEFRIRDAVNDGVTAQTIPNPKWNGTSPTIEDDVDVAKKSIRQNAGILPNRIMLPADVKDVVKKDSTVRNLLRYTVARMQGEVLVRDGDLPEVLWNMRTVIAGAIYNSANEGQDASISDIWGDNVLVYFYATGVSLQQLSLGYVMRVKQGAGLTIMTKRWRDNPRDSNVFQVGIIEDEKIVASECGYQITDCLEG